MSEISLQQAMDKLYYDNEKMKNKVAHIELKKLWENPNPLESFAVGTRFNLSSDDYDYLEILYVTYYNNDTQEHKMAYHGSITVTKDEILLHKKIGLCGVGLFSSSFGGVMAIGRILSFEKLDEIEAYEGWRRNVSSNPTVINDDWICRPIAILGGKYI